MKIYFLVNLAIILIIFQSCGTVAKQQSPMNVVFSEDEVPFIQQTKKDGKLSAEIVEPAVK